MITERPAIKRLFFCLVLLLAPLFISCSQEETPSIRIGTGIVTGTYHDVGLAIVRKVNANQASNGFHLDYDISTGSVSNINAIGAGNLQFGIAQADHQYQAVKGLGEWRETGPQSDLRSVFSLYAESVTLVAGGDSEIRTMNDLRGQLVDIGSYDSGTRSNAIDALRAAGIDWEREIQVREENVDDRLANFMRGEVDAFFFTAGHPNKEIKFATFAVRGARLVPLANIEGLVSENPYYSRTIILSDVYPMARNARDIETIGVNATLLTSARVSDDVVYAVTKAVIENLESMTDFNAEFENLLEGDFLEGSTAPIHPGALRYYQEAGLEIPSG